MNAENICASTCSGDRNAHAEKWMNPQTSGITVIICAFNSASRLPATLLALGQQTLGAKDWELLIVDNGSTDTTPQVCRDSWQGNPVPLRIVREEQPGQSQARQTGIRSAHREFVCFVDDDNHLCPTYLSDALRLMTRRPEVGLLGGCGVAITESEKPAWLWRGWQSHAVGPQGRTDEGYISDARGFVYGAGVTIRQGALRQVLAADFTSLLTGRNGNSLSSGEDVELCFALRILGWKIYYCPQLQFGHYMPSGRLTWSYCQRLFTAFGEANAVLELYQPWLTLGKKAALKRSLVGAFLFELMELRRLNVRLKKLPPDDEGNIAALQWNEARGKKAAILKNLRSGHFFSLHREISGFAKRAQCPRHDTAKN